MWSGRTHLAVFQLTSVCTLWPAHDDMLAAEGIRWSCLKLSAITEEIWSGGRGGVKPDRLPVLYAQVSGHLLDWRGRQSSSLPNWLVPCLKVGTECTISQLKQLVNPLLYNYILSILLVACTSERRHRAESMQALTGDFRGTGVEVTSHRDGVRVRESNE